ncbi:MAG: trigger factor [PVC group bacterium]|nr:trigger factor [PVC group bacterium]
MKVKVKNAEKCQKVLEIEVPKETVQAEFDTYYNEVRKTAQVPGFRKGKAPRKILEEYYAGKAYEQVLSDLVNNHYRKAIEKENIDTVSMPEVSDVDLNKDGNLTFKSKVNIRPQFSLKGYKGLKIKKDSVEVTEEEVTKVLSYLQDRYAQFLPIEGRATKQDDYIICDYSYEVEGKTIEKKDKAWFWLDKEMFIPGLSKELQGVNAGDTKEFELTLPENFRPEEVAKKKAKFKVVVNEIKEKKQPELNDEFAKTAGKKSVDELKQHIKDDLVREKEAQAKQTLKAQIVDELIKAMPIDVPQELVDKRDKLLRDTASQKLKQQGLDVQQIEQEEKKLGDYFPQEALKQIRIFFILEEIAAKEKITVTEKEMEERIETIAKSYGHTKEEVLKYFSEKNMLESIHWEIWEEKVISFLVDNANVQGVTAKS